MNFSYDTQGNGTYLLYHLSAGESTDSFALGMASNNAISGVLPLSFSQMDDDRYFRYNVTGLISVKDYLGEVLSEERLMNVLSGLAEALKDADNYMLGESSFLLDTEFMFYSLSKNRTFLICLPVSGSEEASGSLHAFMKNLIYSARFDEKSSGVFFAKMMNLINGKDHLSAGELETAVNEIRGSGKIKTEAVKPSAKSTVGTSMPTSRPQTASQPSSAPQPSIPKFSVPETAGGKGPASPAQAGAYSMKVPAGNAASSPAGNAAPQTPQALPPKPEKEVSFLGLMSHYNAENKALYDAGKKYKKALKEAGKGSAPKASPAAPASAPARNSSIPGRSFNIPGQEQKITDTVPHPTPQKAAIHEKAQPKPAPLPVPNGTVANATPSPSVNYGTAASAQNFGTGAPNGGRNYGNVPQGGFGETTYLGGGNAGETTVLSAQPAQNAEAVGILIRSATKEQIRLVKDEFIIGRQPGYVDYLISGNSSVSRAHAKIIQEGGQFYLVDMNSTNHSFVEGEMVTSNTKNLLKSGMRIRLGSEEFEFRLL